MIASGAKAAFREHGLTVLRWGGCVVLAVAFHAAGVAGLLARWSDSAESIATAPVMLVDFAPVAVAPTTEELQLPPGPQQAEAEPEPEPEPPPEPELDLKPDPAPNPMIAVAPVPPPKPIEPEKPKKKKKQKRRSVASAPSPAERQAAQTAAPAPGAASHQSNALPTWRSMLAARLERAKRYPSEARSRGDQGVAYLAFTIDRSGGVHGARIVRSSGSSILDHETLALLSRAQPLPPPPAELGRSISITVPIRYTMR
jgi:protein TonB